ncbi:MAG: DUF1614 domain-containing protein, partial [Bacillota bacterium]|nr:DUF1614 domain-containing protein [Bacillota bacterium]
MFRFSIGMIALLIVSVLIYFGFAHRVLDRMRLTDRAALAIIAAMILGSFIDIPITGGRVQSSINVGGGIIPIALAIYVLTRAGTSKEWLRAIIAIAVTAIAVYFTGQISDADPGAGKGWPIDPIYVIPIIAGTVAYIAGRSRRSAFIAATLGVLTLDIINYFFLLSSGIAGVVQIGGAGIFDVIVLGGIIAVLLAEVVGETRERLQGGPAEKGRPKELLAGLKGISSPQAKPFPRNEIDLEKRATIEEAEKKGGESDDKK